MATAAPKAARGKSLARGYPDLHDHLKALDEAGLLVTVDRPIDKDTEMHPLVRWQFRGGIDAFDGSVRHGRAQHEGLHHPWQRDVVGVAALPDEKAHILVAPHGLTDAELHVVAFHPHWLEMISYSIGYTKSVLAQFGKAPIE